MRNERRPQPSKKKRRQTNPSLAVKGIDLQTLRQPLLQTGGIAGPMEEANLVPALEHDRQH